MLIAYLIYKNQKATDIPEIISVKDLPFNYNALTIPPFGIFIKQDHVNNRNLIAHELMHWQQYRQMGLVNYHATYLSELMKYGYDQMPMEIMARFNEREYCKNNYTDCVRKGISNTVLNQNFRS